jgi:predicted RNA-binding Zn-ribbon protein involved in translation (DUF1610 family)
MAEQEEEQESKWGKPWHCRHCGEVVHVARVDGALITLECDACGEETIVDRSE